MRGILLSLFIFIAHQNVAHSATPFLTRDQNPLNIIYGSPLPTAAVTAPARQWNSVWSVNIANTLNVDNTGDEMLFIDGEIYQANLLLDYGINDRWTMRLELPFIAHSPGSMDQAIDDYHELLGLRRGERPNFPQDQLRFTYQRNGTDLLRIEDSGQGLGDIQLIAGRQLQKDSDLKYSVWAGVKLPTGDSDRLTGSGGTDFSSWIAAEKTFNGEWQAYGTAGVLLLGNGDILNEIQEDTAAFGMLGINWQYSQKLAIKTQLDWHTAYYQDTGVRFLGDVSQLTFGFSWQWSPGVHWDFAIAEDIKVDASPDVNFNITFHIAHN